MHMPVSPRLARGGLCLVAVTMSLCVVVLILGASRNTVNHAGLPGSLAPTFSLRDSGGAWYGPKDSAGKITLVLITPADARGDALQPRQLQQVNDVYNADAEVTMLGIQFFADDMMNGGQTDASKLTNAALLQLCPGLRVLNDFDRTVTNAFRVVDKQPTFFVIDNAGIIRGRIPLSDSAAIAVTETISSLKTPIAPQQPFAPHTS